MLPRNDFLKDCVELLDGSRNVRDQQLACWFQLQQIIDDTLIAFSADNTRYKSPCERPHLQPILRYFGTQMRSWEGNLIRETTTSMLHDGCFVRQVPIC